jgi:hypothetical protein
LVTQRHAIFGSGLMAVGSIPHLWGFVLSGYFYGGAGDVGLCGAGWTAEFVVLVAIRNEGCGLFSVVYGDF